VAYYLLDTCILIDFFRGKKEAVQFLESLDSPPFLSSLTVAELYAGVREGKERAALDSLVQYFPIVPLNDEAAISGGLYRRQYGKSHGVGMIDALLAACAESKNLILTTRNVKHFPMIKNVHCPY
jgi:predicted nucleic acid-binding protein